MKAIIKKGGLFSTYYRFVLKAKNGEVVGKSTQHYTQKHNAIKTLTNCFSQFEIVDKTGEA